MKTAISILTPTILLAATGCTQNQKLPPDLNFPAPAVYTTSGRFSRIIVARLKQNTDLLDGLRETVKKENIKNAVILTGIGSLTQHHIHVVSNSSFPPTNAFVKETIPSDLLNVNGYIMNGRVHAHITLSTGQKAIGGHLEPDTKVFTFAIITIGVLPDNADVRRLDDWKW